MTLFLPDRLWTKKVKSASLYISYPDWEAMATITETFEGGGEGLADLHKIQRFSRHDFVSLKYLWHPYSLKTTRQSSN